MSPIDWLRGKATMRAAAVPEPTVRLRDEVPITVRRPPIPAEEVGRLLREPNASAAMPSRPRAQTSSEQVERCPCVAIYSRCYCPAK